MKMIPVILCGGSGTRLWPVSRESYPKQFLSLIDDLSLLQNTALRAMRVSKASPEDIVFVSLSSLADEVKKQVSQIDKRLTQNIICEPVARNTAAAISLAALYVQEKFGNDAVMWVLPSDHHIGKEEALVNALSNGLKVINKNYLVTFGIEPTRPDTGYGYIRHGKKIDGTEVYHVSKFVEKPNLSLAQEYVISGDYQWNSGMFLFKTSTILDELKNLAPQILEGVQRSAAETSLLQPCLEIYSTVSQEPFDKAIMEKSKTVGVVLCNPKWSDVGTWESIWDISLKTEDGNAYLGNTYFSNSRNCLVRNHGKKLIACAGLDDIVIVDTGDAILVAKKSDSDSLKKIVEELKKSNATELTKPPAFKK